MKGVYRPAGRANYMIKYQRDGKWIPEATGTSDLKEAEQLLRERQTDIGRGVPLGVGVGKIRFEKAADNIRADYLTRGLRSLKYLNIKLAHLAATFSGRRMSTITAAEVREYAVARLAEKYSKATVDSHLATLRRMFTIAIEDGALLYAPKIKKLLKDNENARQGFFEREQFDRVIALMPERMRAPLKVAYLTGWRVQSELLPLEWAHVERSQLRLPPSMSKNKEGRVFPFDQLPELADLMAQLRRDTERWQRRHHAICQWVFHDEDGHPFRQPCGDASVAFRDAWTAACIEAGYPDRLKHDLRRTAVRNLTRAGTMEKVAQKLTGHKTRAVFDRYNIVNEGDLNEGVARLAAAALPARKGGRVVQMRRKRG